jgi:soluble cytochrome b562
MTEIKEGYKISLMTLKTFNTEHEQNMKKLAKDMTKLNSIKNSESYNFEKEIDTLVHGFSFFFYGSHDIICII